MRLTEVDNRTSTQPRIAKDSQGNLHIVFNDFRHGPPELYYMKVDNEGNILINETTLTTLDSISSRLGDCACDSLDNIHIVWDDTRDSGPIPNMEIYYMKLDSMGNKLIDETRITNFPHNSLYPSITTDSSDNVHIVWCEEVNIHNVLQEEIFYTKLDNDGNTLVNDMALTESDGEESLFPDIEADSNGNIHVVWLDDRNETGTTQCQDVYYTKLDNNGNTIIDDINIFAHGDFYRPNIIIDSEDMIHLTFGSLQGWKGNVYKQIYYIKMDNDGNFLVGEKRLTDDEGNASHPALHLDSDENIHIVWQDERHENTEIFYMKVDNEGNILHNELRLTVNSSESIRPEIEIGENNNVNVVWADERDYPDEGKYEIYYKFYFESIPNNPPTVAITSPNAGETVSGIILITGWANDTDGPVLLVQVRIDNGDWINATGTSSWEYPWDTTNASEGIHTIYARSFDGIDYSFVDIKSVTVDNIPVIPPNNPPAVTIIPPEEEKLSGTITITGTASDSDGSVQKVEIKIDGEGEEWISVKGITTWTYSWDTTEVEDGEHVIYARAEDNEKEQSSIEYIYVIVDNKGNTPPEINITSPTENTVSGIVVISGTASDIDGNDTIISIQVKIEGDWEDAEGTLAWSYIWNTSTLDDGEYTIYARAFDGEDYSTTKSFDVNVDNPHPPMLTITSEIPMKVSGTLTIQGTTSDIDGEIEKLEVQIDDGEWEEIEATRYWSYELDSKKLSNGEHIISIRVTDDEGESFMETLTIEVENLEEFPWEVLLLGLILIIILVIIIIAVIKTRSSSRTRYARYTSPESHLLPQFENLKCLYCGNAFEADASNPIIICPYCGVSGSR